MKFFEKYSALFTSILVFVIYLFTLAPSVIQIDSGELAAVQSMAGIAHPTGYPLFTMIGYLFLKLPLPLSQIIKANLLATVWCSLGVYLFIKCAVLILSNTKSQPEIKNKKAKESRNYSLVNTNFNSIWITLASTTSGTILALSKTYWMQSTSVEVYSLQIFLFMLIIFTSLKAYFSQTNKYTNWLWVGIAYAFGFANHMTTMLAIPFSAILFFQKEKFSKRSFLKIALTIITAFPVLLLLYSYLPLRASANPALNWGNPVSWENLIRHISGKQYQVWLFASFEAAGKQFKYFLSNFPEEFAYIGLVVGIIGFFYFFKLNRKLFITVITTLVAAVLYSINYDIVDIDSYFLLAYIMFSFLIAFGIIKILQIAEKKFTGNRLVKYSVGLIALVPLFINFQQVSQSNSYTFEDYTKAILNSVENNSIIFSYQWDYFVSSSLYFQNVENYRKDVAVIDKELLRRSWYFKQIKTNHPEVIKKVKPEFTAFLESLKPFETDGVYDSGLLESNYRTLMTSLVEKNIDERNFYIGIELMQGEMERGEFTLPQGYQIVPHLLMFKVVKEASGYVPAPDPNFTIRFSAEKNKYVQFIESFVGSMLTYRAAYELQFNKPERAKAYVEKVKREFPNYQIPYDILSRVK